MGKTILNWRRLTFEECKSLNIFTDEKKLAEYKNVLSNDKLIENINAIKKYVEIWENDYLFYSISEIFTDYAHAYYFQQNPLSIPLGVFENDEIIGAMAINVNKHEDLANYSISCNYIVVRPDVQNKGIGKKMLYDLMFNYVELLKSRTWQEIEQGSPSSIPNLFNYKKQAPTKINAKVHYRNFQSQAIFTKNGFTSTPPEKGRILMKFSYDIKKTK